SRRSRVYPQRLTPHPREGGHGSFPFAWNLVLRDSINSVISDIASSAGILSLYPNPTAHRSQLSSTLACLPLLVCTFSPRTRRTASSSRAASPIPFNFFDEGSKESVLTAPCWYTRSNSRRPAAESPFICQPCRAVPIDARAGNNLR